MSRVKLSYLRTLRMRSGLSQAEAAFLLGMPSRKVMSRYELIDHSVALEEIIALQIIFNVPVHELYPSLHLKVEILAVKRIQTLMIELEGEADSRENRYRRKILSRMMKRIGCA